MSSVSDIPELIETTTSGSSTNLDLVHPVIPEESFPNESPFLLDSSPFKGSGKKSRGKVMILNDPLLDRDLENGSYSPKSSGGGGGLLVMDAISMEGYVCSSPDSGVVQDDFRTSAGPPTPSAFRVRTGAVTCTSNGVAHAPRSSILRDESPVHSSYSN